MKQIWDLLLLANPPRYTVTNRKRARKGNNKSKLKKALIYKKKPKQKEKSKSYKTKPSTNTKNVQKYFYNQTLTTEPHKKTVVPYTGNTFGLDPYQTYQANHPKQTVIEGSKFAAVLLSGGAVGGLGAGIEGLEATAVANEAAETAAQQAAEHSAPAAEDIGEWVNESVYRPGLRQRIPYNPGYWN